MLIWCTPNIDKEKVNEDCFDEYKHIRELLVNERHVYTINQHYTFSGEQNDEEKEYQDLSALIYNNSQAKEFRNKKMTGISLAHIIGEYIDILKQNKNLVLVENLYYLIYIAGKTSYVKTY